MCNCAETETWAELPDQPGYEVSDHGNVRSWKYGSPPRIISQGINTYRNNYRLFGTSQGTANQYTIKTHAAVMAAFVGPRPSGLDIRHLDGDVSNNHLSNLAYGTHLENEQDKYRHGTRKKNANPTCRHGHLYDEVNTRWTDGKRYCRQCSRDIYARNAAENARKARERRALKHANATVQP
jgi:hypothetical protein